MYLPDKKVLELKLKARDIRKSIVTMLAEAGSGHTAGPLGMADVFTLFYFHALKHTPKNPAWEDRDRVILSNGHICPVLYASMAHSGYFPIEELLTLRKFGSRLQGHPHREFLPYVETSSGKVGIDTICLEEDSAREVKKEGLICAAAIGVKDVEERVKSLADAGVNIIVIDIAHGHSKYAGKTLDYIKQNFP